MSKSAMLRTRRRDVNVKPNRRLDRKSSRGMIYENEELRLRTININAEIERGQSDIKKLRRENEQLRKEIWCLRDEYEKLDKLLKDKDDETSTYSSESDSCTSCSESDEENEQSQNMENVQKTTLNNLRTEFDHLSIVTEETSAENSDKNSSSAVSPKEVWNIIAPDQGYPNTLSSSRSTLPIDQIPKHFFAPLKTSKSYENCTATENLGISSWSLGSNTQWPPFPNTNFDQPNPVKPLINNSGYVPYMAEVARKSSLEACKKTSTDILVKTDSCQPYSKHASSASFTNGGNLEELLQDIETISQDILQISALDAQKTNGDTGRPFKSEMSVVLMPKAMPLIGFDKYQHLNSSVDSLEKSIENLNAEKAKLDIGNIHTTNVARNLEDLINNEIYPLSRTKPPEQISRIIENPNQHLNPSRNPTETIPNPNNDIPQNEALLLTRFVPNPMDPTIQTIKTPNEVAPRPKTPKFPNELLSFTPNPIIDPNEPDLQRQSNPFFYGTFGNYSDQFSNRYNPELFAHDNFGFKNEVLQQSSNKLDETDHEKMNLKTNLDNETAEKNNTPVKDTKTDNSDEKNTKKEEQKSPKSRRTRKMSIYFKGKKDKLARSLSLDTKISQKNLESLFDKSPKIEVSSKTTIDPKFDPKLQESDTKTSSDSKTSIDRKHRKSSSTSPERKHVHVKLDDEKMKKGHKKRHRKSDKRPNSNRTNSIDRGGRERSFSVCTDRSNILDHKFGHFDEYTNSERDRSNSLSSCDTVKSRKMSAVPQFQVSGKIPWFGCWGNGCL